MKAELSKEREYLYEVELDEEEILHAELMEKCKRKIGGVLAIVMGILSPFLMDGDATATLMFFGMAYLILKGDKETK
jgi:hypothetical protein